MDSSTPLHPLYYPKGNGRAEAAVKVAESMLKKADDFHSALLLYRNTLPQGHTYSPAQRMFLCHTKTILPTADHHLASVMINFSVVKKDILKKRHDSKAYYDRSAGAEDNPVEVGSYTYAKPPPCHGGQRWIYGEVIKTEPARSYTICTSHGTMIRRNRVQLTPAAAAAPFIQPEQLQTAVRSVPVDMTVHPTPAPNPSKQADVHPQSEQKTQEQPNTTAEPISEARLRQTRSGRTIKSPKRLKDYVMD